jgi:hypothetical protein
MSAVDQKQEIAIRKYEADVASQTASGPFVFTPEQIAANKKVFSLLTDIIPFDDIHKHSDCDLIYRFLIAKRFNIDETVKGLREYVKWRADNKINEIIWEPFPDELERLYRFQGIDLFGQPIGYNRPDPTFVGEMMQKYPRELIIRYNMKVIEQGRRICLSLGADRIASIVDMDKLGISIVRNMGAMGLLKEVSTLIQHQFPENMKTMLIQNGGYVFSGIWAIVKPFLDERVQKKIQNVGSGDSMQQEMLKWVDVNTVPVSFGGKGPETIRRFRALAEIDTLPKGSAPTWPIGAYKGALAFEDTTASTPSSPASPPATPAC